MTDIKQKVIAIILAAGAGSRMSSEKTKQTMLVCGETVLKRTLLAFERASVIDGIILVCRSGEEKFAAACAAGMTKIIKTVVGGNSRAESAKYGFDALEAGFDGTVLIHDGARCLITADDIERVAMRAIETGAATASYPITDTVKKTDEKGMISETVDRSTLVSVQTPQGFCAQLYRKALESVASLDSSVTDDCSLMENIGIKVECVTTSKNNIKITTPEDIALAEFIISAQRDK